MNQQTTSSATTESEALTRFNSDAFSNPLSETSDPLGGAVLPKLQVTRRQFLATTAVALSAATLVANTSDVRADENLASSNNAAPAEAHSSAIESQQSSREVAATLLSSVGTWGSIYLGSEARSLFAVGLGGIAISAVIAASIGGPVAAGVGVGIGLCAVAATVYFQREEPKRVVPVDQACSSASESVPPNNFTAGRRGISLESLSRDPDTRAHMAELEARLASKEG